MKYFCQSCGFANEYNGFNRPDKCESCNKDFNKIEATIPTKIPKKIVAKHVEEAEETETTDEDEEIIEIPDDLNTADVVIEGLAANQNKLTFGQVLQGGGGVDMPRARVAGKVNQKQFMKDFAKNNGSFGPSVSKTHRVKKG